MTDTVLYLLSILILKGRLTTVYEYDNSGRVMAVIAPTGTRTPIRSWIGETDDDNRKLFTVGIGENIVKDNSPPIPTHTLSLTQDKSAYFTHGMYTKKTVGATLIEFGIMHRNKTI